MQQWFLDFGKFGQILLSARVKTLVLEIGLSPHVTFLLSLLSLDRGLPSLMAVGRCLCNVVLWVVRSVTGSNHDRLSPVKENCTSRSKRGEFVHGDDRMPFKGRATLFGSMRQDHARRIKSNSHTDNQKENR